MRVWQKHENKNKRNERPKEVTEKWLLFLWWRFGCPMLYNLMVGMTWSQPAFHSVHRQKYPGHLIIFNALCWLPLRPFVLYRIISTLHLILMFYYIRFFSRLFAEWEIVVGARPKQAKSIKSRLPYLAKMNKTLTIHSTLIDTSRGVESRVAETTKKKKNEHKENPFRG